MEEDDRSRGLGSDGLGLAPLKGVKRSIPSLASEMSRRSRNVSGWSIACQAERAESEEEGAIDHGLASGIFGIRTDETHALISSGVL